MKLKELKDLISKIEKENSNNLDDCEVFIWGISDSDHILMKLENAIIGHHPLSTREKRIYLTVD